LKSGLIVKKENTLDFYSKLANSEDILSSVKLTFKCISELYSKINGFLLLLDTNRRKQAFQTHNVPDSILSPMIRASLRGYDMIRLGRKPLEGNCYTLVQGRVRTSIRYSLYIFSRNGKILQKEDMNKIKVIMNILCSRISGFQRTLLVLDELKRMEIALASVKDFSEIVTMLGGGDQIAIQSMFMGFSAESIGADRVTFYYYDELAHMLYPNLIMVYQHGRLDPYDYYTELKDLSIPLGRDSCGLSIQTNKPIFIKSLRNTNLGYEGYVDRKIGLRCQSIIDIPLIGRESILGVIEIGNTYDNRAFTENDFNISLIIANLTLNSLEKSSLYNWATTDSLTNLYNYHYLQMVLDREISRVKRYTRELSMILLDVDNFKTVNDTYGHLFGNFVLQEISRAIQAILRQNIDIPVRYGGDEFLIILPETDQDGAILLAERIQENVRRLKLKHENKTVKLTVSIGVASLKKRKRSSVRI